jgi:hypothetical protein
MTIFEAKLELPFRNKLSEKPHVDYVVRHKLSDLRALAVRPKIPPANSAMAATQDEYKVVASRNSNTTRNFFFATSCS